MTYKTHLTAGMTTALIVSEMLQDPIEKMVFIAASTGAALLPDIDHESSYIRRYIPLFFPMKHRGFTHSITGLLVFSLIIIPLGINGLTTGLIWGYLSHLLADACTVYGIYPFYPNKMLHLKFANVKTGTQSEKVFECLMICTVFLYFYYKLKGC